MVNRSIPRETAVAEFAGRDSVAAIIQVFDTTDIEYILPVASFSPTEYGDKDIVEENHKCLTDLVKKRYGGKKHLLPLITYSVPEVWRAINGRFTAEIIKRFGIYTPCIGCHAYFHLIRMPFAAMLGGRLISGERASHDGSIKINQSEKVLEFYSRVCAEFGIELMQPLKDIEDGEQIKKLLGLDWEQGQKHVECVYSGNFKDTNGNHIYSEEQVSKYLDFLYDICVISGREIMSGIDIEAKALIRKISDHISKMR